MLIETIGQKLQDYQLKGRSYTDEPEAAKQFREAFNEAFKKIQQADVVILTLGLSEVWFDKQTQLYLNAAVPVELYQRYPNRFEVHVFDYKQTLFYLNGIYQLLDSYLKPGFRLLVTVSPIPLSFTFRSQDILTANAYSKAVLRAAVEEFLVDKENVNYFASYELVSLSNPNLVWSETDLRHVDSVFVDYIMANVMQHFSDDTLAEQTCTLAKAKALYNKSFISEAKQVLKPLLEDKSFNSKEVQVLWNASQLGINAKKSNLLELLEHFKTYRHLNPFQQIHQLWLVYRNRNNRSFISYIDGLQNSRLIGWASNTQHQKSVSVNIFVNDQLMTTVLADQPRADVKDIYGGYLYCGFNVTLNLNKAIPNKINVVFAETGKELSGSPIFETTH